MVVIMMAPKNVGKNLWAAKINTGFPTSASGIMLELTQAEAMMSISTASTAKISTFVANFAPSAFLLAKKR